MRYGWPKKSEGRKNHLGITVPLGRNEFTGSVSRHSLKGKRIIKQTSTQTSKQNLGEGFGVLEPKNLTEDTTSDPGCES